MAVLCCRYSLLLLLSLLLLGSTLVECRVTNKETSAKVPDEKWGYVTVREHAHMFWWLYGALEEQARSELPLVLWLQGGPGGSGTGFGNFAEIGKLDADLKPRNTTWLKKANLLFIDNPVGAGFSYVDDNSALTTNVTQIADDLFVIFSAILEQLPILKRLPFYIFCESYGGKMTAVFGERLHEGIMKNEIQCNFKGVALGDSWISPVDSVISWGPFLYQYNLLDDKDLAAVMNISQRTVDAVNNGDYMLATTLWGNTEDLIDATTDYVDVYNVLLHRAPPFPTAANHVEKLYNRHVSVYYHQSLADLMNGKIREKLAIIPPHVKWGAQSGLVFQYQSADFMKPVVKYVDKLISYGLKVVVFQGQLDMICDTPGAELWIKKLAWKDLDKFLVSTRKPLYTGKDRKTQAFLKTHDNFSLFYIMNAGHMVPSDNGPMALQMLSHVIM